MELRPKGRRHSILRDKRAVSHHYSLSNEYFSLFLDESMTYSCAIWSRGATTLEEAQRTKLELVCAKLGLQPGQRVLDVGCGWGSFAIHAAREHGVHVTGITLSEPQAALARERARDAGLADRVEIRVMDYRELAAEPFDAIASIGMVEHVGSVNIDAYFATLAGLRATGRAGPQPRDRAVEASATPRPGHSRSAMCSRTRPRCTCRGSRPRSSAPGCTPRHVEDFPQDYARTLLEWQRRFEANIDRAREIGGDERVRVWRIYLRVSRQGFESGFMSPYQVPRGRVSRSSSSAWSPCGLAASVSHSSSCAPGPLRPRAPPAPPLPLPANVQRTGGIRLPVRFTRS